MTATAEKTLTPEQEHDSAVELVAALEERVREGDESVSPDEIESARSLVRFARLRMDAAVRREAREDADRKAAALAKLRAEFGPLQAEYAALESSSSSAVAALREIIADFRRRAVAADAAYVDLVGRLVSEAGIVREFTGGPPQTGPVRIDSLGRVILDGVPSLEARFQGTNLDRAVRELVDAALGAVGGA